MDLRFFITLLSVTLIGLKLSGVITASWWLVLIPLYPAILMAAVGLVSVTVFGVMWARMTKDQREDYRTARLIERLKRGY